MLVALVRCAVISVGLLLFCACGRAIDNAPSRDAGLVAPIHDLPSNAPPPLPPPPRDAGPSPDPGPSCVDRSLGQFCAASPTCSYDRIEEDSYVARFLDRDPRCPDLLAGGPDAGLDAGADAQVDPACRQRAIADFSCACRNSATGAAYTLVFFNGGYTSLSLYYANGDAGPAELVAAVTTTDVCDECGCATYYGERIDCACPYDPNFGSY
jgi:hypothetical protein